MGLRIATNVQSMSAQRNLLTTGERQAASLTKLSSGSRISKAGDDAAGLAISEKLKASLRSMQQAGRNANDGVSMIQTASSALSSLTNSLQRIRQLAVQASTGTMSSTDQAALQQEVAQQIQEVNRIASQTTYNGTNILNGNAGIVSFQVGANVRF